jgi:putative colanic acid biosynthesis acetyltransferase WcaF
VPDRDRPELKVDLRLYSTREGLEGGYDKGRGWLTRAVWMVVNAVVFLNPVLPAYRFKAAVLRAFGAKVGEGVVIKPSVNIKYPWFLTVGDHSWIGEGAWLECSSPLRIGNHVVISQGVYLCCGTHDWEDPGMGSMSTPITIEDGAWVAAFARVGGNVTIGQEAMIALGAVVFTDCQPRMTYRGNPAQQVGRRRIRDYPGPRRIKRRPVAAAKLQPPTEPQLSAEPQPAAEAQASADQK